MKVLLVNPPDTKGITLPGAPQIHMVYHTYGPPMGLMYLRSYIRSVSDIDIRIFNFQLPKGPSMADFEKCLAEFRPEVVGITTMIVYYYNACQVAKKVKEILPRTLVVGGGPNMWTCPEQCMARPEFDVIVQGEGEVTLKELLVRYQKK